MHSDLETITEINVDDLAGNPIEHQVGWMSVTETEDVSDDRHNTQRPCVVCATIEPGLRTLTLEPEHSVEILTSSIVQGVAEDLNLLHESQVVVIRRHLKHDTMLDVEKNLATLAIFPNENVESVGVRNPTKETGALR